MDATFVLVVGAAVLIGFCAGYGVRSSISRRRRIKARQRRQDLFEQNPMVPDQLHCESSTQTSLVPEPTDFEASARQKSWRFEVEPAADPRPAGKASGAAPLFGTRH